MESIVPQPLTAQRFAPFGDVIEARQSSALMINQGTSTRFHDLAAVDVGAEGGRTLVNIFRATPYPLPLVIRMMEKHPLGFAALYAAAGPDLSGGGCVIIRSSDPGRHIGFCCPGAPGGEFLPRHLAPPAAGIVWCSRIFW